MRLTARDQAVPSRCGKYFTFCRGKCINNSIFRKTAGNLFPMTINKLEFICPFCKGDLEEDAGAFRCPKCEKRYFSLSGIYDFTGKFSSIQELLRSDGKARLLYEGYDSHDHKGLLKLEEEYNQKWRESLPQEIQELYAGFSKGMMERGRQRYDQAKAAIRDFGATTGHGSALDIGCSSGATLFHIAGEFGHATGIEPAISKLIIAKKYAQENAIDNVTLICGVGEYIPIKSGSFDFVHALNVIEHVPDQQKAIGEIHRVMAGGGVLCFDSRNRYDIFKPEPHVKVRFVGFVPRGLQGRYVKYMNKMEYEGIRLLSCFELSRLLRPLFGGSFKVMFPRLTDAGTGFNTIYGILQKVPALSFVFKVFFPTYQVVAVKR